MLHSVAPFKVVTPFDPAIDDEKSNVPLYAQTRDMKHLVFKPGMAPKLFYVKRLSNSRALSIRQHATSEDFAAGMAFMAGVVQVDNIPTESGVIPTWKPAYMQEGKHGEGLTQDEFDSPFFGEDEIIDIGAVIRQRSNLPFGRPAYYALPQLSVEGLAKKALSSRPADVPTLPSKKQDEQQAQLHQKQESDGATLTDATAKENQLQA